ncbi:MAG TPA: hypothetical protein VGA81_20210 [Methylomirabilota bacterium]
MAAPWFDEPNAFGAWSGALLGVLGTDTGPVPVRPDEIRVRFNNWDRVRAERLPLLAINAALLGMGIVLLGIGTRRALAPA